MTGKATGANMKTYRKPRRIFEDSGIVNPEEAYHVRLNNVTNTRKQDIKTMVNLGRYFSIFAPRQSGKTTFLEDFCGELHRDPTYIVILLSFQEYKNIEAHHFYELAKKEVYAHLRKRLKEVGCEKMDEVNRLLDSYHLTNHISFRLLFDELNQIIASKKIVVFIDEFDGIPLGELENFLTSLRELYLKYKKVKQKALYSVGLIGIRNMTKLIVGGVSPFNIADQVELPPFSLKNVFDLFDNLYEKAKLYKETFVEIVFDNVEYNPDDEDQTWLEQYGLIKNKNGHAVVANNIYKARYLNTFFKEVKATAPPGTKQKSHHPPHRHRPNRLKRGKNHEMYALQRQNGI
jgi:hypothetical protein